VQCADSAVINTTPGGDGELVGLCEITGLTGKWTGASGYLQSMGTFTLEAGGAERYFGKIVIPIASQRGENRLLPPRVVYQGLQEQSPKNVR
jgi:hypothetical protein